MIVFQHRSRLVYFMDHVNINSCDGVWNECDLLLCIVDVKKLLSTKRAECHLQKCQRPVSIITHQCTLTIWPFSNISLLRKLEMSFEDIAIVVGSK